MEDIEILLFRNFLFQANAQRYYQPSLCTKHSFSSIEWEILLSDKNSAHNRSILKMTGDVGVLDDELDSIHRLYQAAIIMENDPQIVSKYPMPLLGQMFDNVFEQVGGRIYYDREGQKHLYNAITKIVEHFLKIGINVAGIQKRRYYVMWLVCSISYDRLKLTIDEKLNHADTQDVDKLLKSLESETGFENILQKTLEKPLRFQIEHPPLVTEIGLIMNVVAQELDVTNFPYPMRMKAYMY